jgi:hypothetical protein
VWNEFFLLLLSQLALGYTLKAGKYFWRAFLLGSVDAISTVGFCFEESDPRRWQWFVHGQF